MAGAMHSSPKGDAALLQVARGRRDSLNERYLNLGLDDECVKIVEALLSMFVGTIRLRSI